MTNNAMTTGIKAHGVMELALTKADGSTEKIIKDNLITNVGYSFICACIGNDATRPGVMNHIAIGTNSAAATAANTALGSEQARAPANYEHVAGTRVFTMEATFPAGVGISGNFTEAGVFNAANDGTMLDRVVFPAVSKSNEDLITVKFTFTMS